MEMNELFVMATRKKFRFPYKGMISVEDLWDLGVKELDKIFKALNAEIKQNKEESLLATKSEKDVELEAMIKIVKFIVKTKQEEATAKIVKAANDAQRSKIAKLIEAKKDKALEDMSVEELEALLAGMGN